MNKNINILFFTFSSIVGYYKILNRVPCATLQIPVIYLFYISSSSYSRSVLSDSATNFVFSLSSVQLFSRVQLFATPWTAARQASLSITSSQSLLKLMSIESVMPSNHLILCCPLLLLPSIFPSIGSFPMIWDFALDGQSIGVSASVSVLSMNIQDWFPLRLTVELSDFCWFFSYYSVFCYRLPSWKLRRM